MVVSPFCSIWTQNPNRLSSLVIIVTIAYVTNWSQDRGQETGKIAPNDVTVESNLVTDSQVKTLHLQTNSFT